jgi:hypothetical protein
MGRLTVFVAVTVAVSVFTGRLFPVTRPFAAGKLVLGRIRSELRAEPAAGARDEPSQRPELIAAEISHRDVLVLFGRQLSIGIQQILDGLLKLLLGDRVSNAEFRILLPHDGDLVGLIDGGTDFVTSLLSFHSDSSKATSMPILQATANGSKQSHFGQGILRPARESITRPGRSILEAGEGFPALAFIARPRTSMPEAGEGFPTPAFIARHRNGSPKACDGRSDGELAIGDRLSWLSLSC